jgi:YVTN family beta-propeller protein
MNSPRCFFVGLGSLLLAACVSRPAPTAPGGEPRRLPTGRFLDPAGRSFDVGSFPVSAAAAPEPDRLVLLLNGFREQGVQVVSPQSGKVLQTLPQPAAFVGLRFDHAGRTLFASGGDQDVVYRYRWARGAATLTDSIVLAARPPKGPGTRYPAGVALSPDDAKLYVAENLADSLAVVDLATGRVVQRLPSGRYPYDVVVAQDGTVYASAWGGFDVAVYRPEGNSLRLIASVAVGRHPSAMLLNGDGSRLFVASASTDHIAVVDTRTLQVIAQLDDGVPGGTGEGSTPNALALTSDERRLLVAEADNNAVAAIALSPRSSGIPAATGNDSVVGRIPVQWYPTALSRRGDTVIVVNGKGRGTAPNPTNGPGPGRLPPGQAPGYTLSQLSGSITLISPGESDSASLSGLTARVARLNGWDQRPAQPSYPRFEHVIYVIKENRTFDQVLGDLPRADGDTSLTFFPRNVTPNHHALAERFGIFDRFFVNAEVSADGHIWSMAGYTPDYVQKTLPSVYSDRGRSYDYEGMNRDRDPAPDDDVAEPARGYLWDLAQRKGISFRNFGEFVMPEGELDQDSVPRGYRGLKKFLAANTDSIFPGFDLKIPDQRRADVWLRVLEGWTRVGSMPALQILRLPNDHTTAAKQGAPTPRAYAADNDLALGRVIEGLSRSPFWRSTIVFVVEDDAQNGPDHVDSHRSVLLVISAYNRPGVFHRFTNTTDVLATIERVLLLEPLSQFDAFSRPLAGVFAEQPDTTPFTALAPSVPLDERNLAAAPGAKESSRLDFRFEDVADEDGFNHALWLAIKGRAIPYPAARRARGAEWNRVDAGE